MKYRHLLQRLQRMTPQQLNQNVVVYDDNNAYFPDAEVRILKVGSEDRQDAQREGINLDKDQIIIHF